MLGPCTKTSVTTSLCVAAVLLTAAAKPNSHAKPVELLHSVQPSTPADTTIIASPGKVVWVLVTAYCGCPKCCGPNARGLTASGRSISYNAGRIVAADTHLFKFGTQLRIPGYADGEPVEVIDRGGAIKGYHIDVFFPTHEEARAWGKKWLTVVRVEESGL